MKKLVDNNIPVVMVERTVSLPHVDCLNVDDLNGAAMAVQHIIHKGHLRIGFIGRQPTLPISDVEQARFQGYRKALSGAKLPADEMLIQHVEDYSVQEGYQAAKALMSLDHPPSAIFATSDLLAGGILQYLYQCGKKVPEDVSLVGYDNTLSEMLAPPITSVGLSHEVLGDRAIQLLLQRMADVKAPAQSAMIDTVLIDRHSVREIKRTG